jgi:AraC family transcriptional regulator
MSLESRGNVTPGAGQHVGQGLFFGETVSRRAVGDLVLSETIYAPLLRIPRHDHELASFCFVLEGGYDERYGNRDRVCRRGTVVLHPEGEHHANAHHDAQVRLLSVEIGAGRLAAWREAVGVLADSAHFDGGAIGRLALRLENEYRRSDSASSLAVEALVLEVLAETCRAVAPEDAAPAWLATAEAFLRAHFAEPVSVDQVARAADVHPAHLARVFRQRRRTSIGGYLRRLRIEAAREQLSSHDLSLAEIASSAGFADQSHFSRLFRAAFGVSPGAYRRRLKH